MVITLNSFLNINRIKVKFAQGLSEPEFYDDLVYKFRKKNVEKKKNFLTKLKKFAIKRIGYNVDVMRQPVFLVVNPITVNNIVALFDCMPVNRGSDSMIAPR